MNWGTRQAARPGLSSGTLFPLVVATQSAVNQVWQLGHREPTESSSVLEYWPLLEGHEFED